MFGIGLVSVCPECQPYAPWLLGKAAYSGWDSLMYTRRQSGLVWLEEASELPCACLIFTPGEAGGVTQLGPWLRILPCRVVLTFCRSHPAICFPASAVSLHIQYCPQAPVFRLKQEGAPWMGQLPAIPWACGTQNAVLVDARRMRQC